MLSGAKRTELSRSRDSGSVTCRGRSKERTSEIAGRVEGDDGAWDGKCARVSDGGLRERVRDWLEERDDLNDGHGNQRSHEPERRTLGQHKQGEPIPLRRDRLQEFRLQSSPAIPRGHFALSGLLGLRGYWVDRRGQIGRAGLVQ